MGRSPRESLRKVEELFSSEKLVMLFPAGLVSRKINGVVSDLPWQKTFVTKARRDNHPVVPNYIEGELSPFFYRLSNWRKRLGIKANLEILYLANEMYKQKGRRIKYVVGKAISPNQWENTMNDREVCKAVRKELYKLADG